MINQTQPIPVEQIQHITRGSDGVGIARIEQKEDSIVIHLTNHESYEITGLKGNDGVSPSISEVANKVLDTLELPFDEITRLVLEKLTIPIEEISKEVLSQIQIPVDDIARVAAPKVEIPIGKIVDLTIQKIKDNTVNLLDDIADTAAPKVQIPIGKIAELAASKIEVPLDRIVEQIIANISLDDIAEKSLSKIELPIDEIASRASQKIVLPEPNLNEIVERVLVDLPIPKDGKDATFSNLIKYHELQGSTDIGKLNAVLGSISLDLNTIVGVEITLVGKGANNAYFYGSKNALIGIGETSYKIGEDVWRFNPRRSSSSLNIEIHTSPNGIEIVATGTPDEEIVWKGEAKIITL